MIIIKNIINKIISWFNRKNIKPVNEIDNIDYTDSQLKLFNNTKPGDLVFCQMPLCDEELEKVKKGHRCRPYLIVSKTDNFLYGYYCTSSDSGTVVWNEYVLLHNKYHQYKKDNDYRDVPTDTYVSLNVPHKLSIKHLKYYMFSINDFDKRQINKKLVLLNKSGTKLFNVSPKALVSEVYSYNCALYYVFKEENNTLYCYRLNSRQKTGADTIYVRKNKYSIDLDQEYVLNMDYCKLYSMSNISLKNRVDKIIKEDKKAKKNRVKVDNNNGQSKYICKHKIGTIYTNYRDDRPMVYLYSIGDKNFGFDYMKAKDLDYAQIKEFIIDRNVGALFVAEDELMDRFIFDIIELSPKLDIFSKNL